MIKEKKRGEEKGVERREGREGEGLRHGCWGMDAPKEHSSSADFFDQMNFYYLHKNSQNYCHYTSFLGSHIRKMRL